MRKKQQEKFIGNHRFLIIAMETGSWKHPGVFSGSGRHQNISECNFS
jgi:hypothetical protein